MVFFEVRHGVLAAFAIIVLAEVAAGMADGAAADVDIEADVGGIAPFRFAGTEMTLADVNRAIAVFL